MLSLYVHFPFCIKKCSYCVFNSYKLTNNNFDGWLEKYLTSLSYFAERVNKEPLSSIYFGGGTPSLMPIYMIEQIINSANQIFDFKENIEISLEANPGTINQNTVNSLRAAGINRISLGVQSFNDNELVFLDRIHNSSEALKAIDICSNTFENISIDLIYGLPNQSLYDWQNNLKQAVKLNCQHYSLYQLSIEPESKLYASNVKPIDEETAANMFEMNQNFMSDNGFQQYEVSNFSLNGKECLHNILCWQGYDYIGIGAGACSRFNNDPFLGVVQNLDPEKWFENPTSSEIEEISSKTRAMELMITGLRMMQGIDKDIFNNNCHQNLFDLIDDCLLNEFIKNKLLKINKNNLKPTKKGLMVLDYILNKLT